MRIPRKISMYAAIGTILLGTTISLANVNQSNNIHQKYFDDNMLVKISFDRETVENEITKKTYDYKGKYEEGHKNLGYMPYGNNMKINDISLSGKEFITVSYSFKVDIDNYEFDTKSIIPISFNGGNYNLILENDRIGFSTNNNDIYGAQYNIEKNKWYNIIATFSKNNIYENNIYINGEKIRLSQIQGKPLTSNIPFNQNGISVNGKYDDESGVFKFRDVIDEIYILDREVNESEVKSLYLYSRIPEFRLDSINLNKPANPETNLSWALDILDTDLFIARYYDSITEQSLTWNKNEYGKQEISTESVYQGKSSLKVTDTVTKREGNHYNFPYKDSTTSIHTFGRINKVPANIPISMSIKLKTDTNGSYYRLSGDGGWEIGSEFIYHRAKATEIAAVGSRTIFVDDISEFIRQQYPNNNDPAQGYFVSSDKDKNTLLDSTIYITKIYTLDEYNKIKNNKELNEINEVEEFNKYEIIGELDDPNTVKKNTNTKNKVPGVLMLGTGIKTQIEKGETLKYRRWHGPVSFNANYAIADNNWHVYNSNTTTRYSEYYDLINRGFSAYANVSTRGTLFVDSLKFGYATEAIVRRDGSIIYQGYDSNFIDKDAKDITKPNRINESKIEINTTFTNNQKNENERNLNIIWDTVEDNGTNYTYTIQSKSKSGYHSPISNPINTTINTGIKGYSYVIDKNKDTQVDNIVDKTNKLDGDKVSLDYKINDTGTYYLHISAIDNAGNIGETIHVPITMPRLVSVAKHKENYIDLNWYMDGSKEPYQFKVYKKRLDEATYQSGSMMNFEDDTKVNILNIHPNSGSIISKFETWDGEVVENLPQSAQLKRWMEMPNEEHDKGYGKGIIEVTPVDLETFNENPSKYMKNSDGSYKFDGIMIGSWDANSYKDISDEAYLLIDNYIKEGYGVLLGHDTVGYLPQIPNLRKLASYLNMLPANGGPYYNGASATHGVSSLKATVTIYKKGLLTNYPWKIGDIGTQLVVPATHALGQKANGDIWLKFDYNKIGFDDNHNFYLTSWNNVSMVQTGHSNGAATPDEQKILANTLFYIKQLSQEKQVKDNSAQDIDPPTKPSVKQTYFRTGNMIMDVAINKSEDVGTTYKHYIEAKGISTNQLTLSNITTTEIKSGLRGYSYVIDAIENTEPDDEIDTSNEQITIKAPNNRVFYIHIKSIDNVGNASETLHYKIERKQDFAINGYNVTDENNKNVGDLLGGKNYNFNIKLTNSEVTNQFLNLKKTIKELLGISEKEDIDVIIDNIDLNEITNIEDGNIDLEYVDKEIYLDYYDKFRASIKIKDDSEESNSIIEALKFKVYSGNGLFSKSNLIFEKTENDVLTNSQNSINIDFEIKEIPKNHNKITIVCEFDKKDTDRSNNIIEKEYSIKLETNDLLVDNTKSIELETTAIENKKYDLPNAAKNSAMGTSYYKSSNIREWLNSDASKVKYTMPEPTREIHGVYGYNDEAGFLNEFTDKEKEAIAVTKRKSFIQCDLSELIDGGSILDNTSDAHAYQSIPSTYNKMIKSWQDYKYVMVNDKMFLLNAVEYFNYMELRGFEKKYYLMKKAQEKYNYNNPVRWYLGDARMEHGLERDKHVVVTENGSIARTYTGNISTYRYGVVPAFHLKPNYILNNGVQAKNLSIGDVVYFGKYRGENISWKVINISNNGYPLLICDNAIDIKSYNTKNEYVYKESNYINFTESHVDISNDMQRKARYNNDSNPPTLKVINEADVLTKRQSGAYKITVTANDENGIKFIILPNGEKKYTNQVEYTVDSNKEYVFTACDNNENYRQLSVPIGNINVESHALATASTTQWTNKDVTVDIKASNDVSYSIKNHVQSVRDDNGKSWSNYINYKGRRVRVKGKIKFNSHEKDLGYISVGAGITYRSLVKDDNGDYVVKTQWKYPKRWYLKDLKEMTNGEEFDVTYTIPTDYYSSLSVFTQMDVPYGENTYSVLWEKLDVELIDNDDFGIEKIVLPTGQEVKQSSYIDTLTEEGTYTYTIYDNRGESVKRSVTVKIDKVKPDIQITGIPTEWSNKSVDLSVVGSDDRSGVSKIVLPNGSQTTQTSFKYNVSQNGSYTFEIYDLAGNKTTKTINITKVDTKAPVISLDYNPKGWTSGDVVIDVKAIDLDSGINNIKLPNGSIVNKDTEKYTITSNGKYTFEATDNVGNKVSQTISITNIDKEKPYVKSYVYDGNYKNSKFEIVARDDDSGIKRVQLPNGQYVENKTTSKEMTVIYEGSNISNAQFVLEDNIGHTNILNITIQTVDARAISPILKEEIKSDKYDPVVDTLYIDNKDKFIGDARVDIPSGYSNQKIDKIEYNIYLGTKDNPKMTKIQSGTSKDVVVQDNIDGGQAKVPFEFILNSVDKKYTNLTIVTSLEDRDDNNDLNNILEKSYNIEFVANDDELDGWEPPIPTYLDDILDLIKYNIYASDGYKKKVTLKEGSFKNILIQPTKEAWSTIDFKVPEDKELVEAVINIDLEDVNDEILDNNLLTVVLPIIQDIENDIGIGDVSVYPDDECYTTIGTPITIKSTVLSTNVKTQDATAILRLNGKEIERKKVYGISLDKVGAVYFNYIHNKFNNINASSETLTFTIEVEPDIPENAKVETLKNVSDEIKVKVHRDYSAIVEDSFSNNSISPTYDINQDVAVYLKVLKNDKTKIVSNPCGTLCQTDLNGKKFCPSHKSYEWEDEWYSAYIPVDAYKLNGVKETIKIKDVKYRSKYTKDSKDKYSSVIDSDGKLSLVNTTNSSHLIKLKAGYGFELETDIEYQNNLPELFDKYKVKNKALDDRSWTRYEEYKNTNVDLIWNEVDKNLATYQQAVAFTLPSIENIGVEYGNKLFIKTPSQQKTYLSMGNGIKLRGNQAEAEIKNGKYTHVKKYQLGNDILNDKGKYYLSGNTKNGDNYEIKIFTPLTGVGPTCSTENLKVKDVNTFKIDVYGGYLDDIKTQLNE